MMWEGSCGNSQNLRNFPHCINWWLGGLTTLVVFVLSPFVLTCVCLGRSVQLESTRFSHPPSGVDLFVWGWVKKNSINF